MVYKVVEQRQKSIVLKRKMKADDLEQLINQHAKGGWILDRIVAGETARFMGFGDKDVFLLIFRRDEG